MAPAAHWPPTGITYYRSPVVRVGIDANRVQLTNGTLLDYDVLVIATGATLLPEETEGLTGPGWRERVFTFYDLPGALVLRDALAAFDGGRLVVDIVDMPIKCRWRRWSSASWPTGTFANAASATGSG